MSETALAPVPLLRADAPLDALAVYNLMLADGRNVHTLRAYRAAYEEFAAAMGMSSGQEGMASLLSKKLGEANALVQGYKVLQAHKGVAPNTINQHLGAIRSLVRMARMVGLVTWTLEVKNERSEPYRDTQGPSPENFSALLASILERIGERDGCDPKGRRDLAIVRMLYNPALRCKEVAGLDYDDIDFPGSRVRMTPKGSRQDHWVEVPPFTLASLRDWCLHRGEQPGPLFLSLDPGVEAREAKLLEAANARGPAEVEAARQELMAHRRLSRKSIWSVVTTYAAKLGLSIGPHKLRHGGATRVAHATNGNALAVQAFGRWKQLNTAQIYINNANGLGGKASRLIDQE